MKKLFTLALSLGLISSVFAQSGHAREVIGVQSHNKVMDQRNEAARMERDKASQIQKINREFDMKVAQVQNNRWLKNKDKKRQIRQLEVQRKQQIDAVNQKYAHVSW